MTSDWLLPQKNSIRRLNALSLLTGQIRLRTRYGLGILNELVTAEGEILDEDVTVTFAPSREMTFRAGDGRLIDNVLELVQSEADRASSSASCMKPIYTKAFGYTSSASDQSYVFDLHSLLSGTSGLPHNTYITGSDKGISLLARPISVKVSEGQYMEFEPSSITVDEVLAVCRQRHADMSKTDIVWGLKSPDLLYQPASGRLTRKGSTIEYRLCDLLSGESYLPLSTLDGTLCLESRVDIVTTHSVAGFGAGTPLSAVVGRWRIGRDTMGGSKLYTAHVLHNDDILSSRQSIPTYKGIVTRTNLIVKWFDGHVMCFAQNTSAEYVITLLFRLKRLNSPIEHGVSFRRTDGTNTLPHTVVSFNKMDGIQQGARDVLVLLYPHTRPVFIDEWTPESSKKIYGLKEDADEAEKEQRARASVWTAGKIRF